MKHFIALLSLMLTLCFLLPTATAAQYLNANTPVQIEAVEAFNTDNVSEGDSVRFQTVAPVKSRGTTFIRANAPVDARVIMNENNGLNGEPARMILDKFSVQTASGEDIRLRCKQDLSGTRRRVPNVSAGGGFGVRGPIGIFLSLPILSLFVKGHDVTIPQGSEFTCYTLSEFELSG